MYRALALIYRGGQPIFGLPDGFRVLTNGTLGGEPRPVIIVTVPAIVGRVILSKTPLGARFKAIGGNPEAARIAGVPVVQTKLAAFMISGVTAAVAAMILLAVWVRRNRRWARCGNWMPLRHRPSAGVSRMGGRGRMRGTLIGCINLARGATG